jgi:hypothetical protein
MAAMAPAVLPRRAGGSANDRVNVAVIDFHDRGKAHFRNFIDCARSRKREYLNCEILDRHMSTALCHMANISHRTGRKLTFDPATEEFVGDDQANSSHTRKYRAPFVLPEKV